MKKKKIKKITKKKLEQLEKIKIRKQFKEWSEKVKKRDNYKCTICSRTEYLHTHHILPRQNKIFRFDIDNGITLCAKHHKFCYSISAHKNSLVFTLWLLEKRRTQLMQLLEKFIILEIRQNKSIYN